MKTIQISKNIFDYNDILTNEELKTKVVEKNYDINIYDDWYECSIDDIKRDNEQKQNGFDIEKIYFSGFYSQGDGAMFEGYFRLNYNSSLQLINSYVKDAKITKLIKDGKISIQCRFTHYGRYYHHKSYNHKFYIDFYGSQKYYNNIEAKLDFLEEQITEDFELICKDIYRTLEKEYDYLTSETAILETIQANEYEFTENGIIYKTL